MRHRGARTPIRGGNSVATYTAQSVVSASRPRRRLSALAAVLTAFAVATVSSIIGTSLAATPPTSAVNLISNPGFENGLSGWYSYSAVDLHRNARSGSRTAAMVNVLTPTLAKMSVKARNVRHINASVTTRSTAVTVAGRHYHASVWVAADGGSVLATLRLREARAGAVLGQGRVQQLVRVRGWRQLSLDYVARRSGDSLTFTVSAAGLVPGRRLLADDAQLTASDPIPTPTPTASSTDTPTATPTDTPTATPTDTPTATPTDTPTPTPTPTPTTTPTLPTGGGPLIGMSMGGSVGSTEALFPNMKAARFFYPGAPSTWGGAIATIPANQVILVSFNTDPAMTAAGGFDAKFTEVLRSWAGSGRQIYWNWQHEADNPSKGISQATYRAAWDRLLADAAAVHASNLHSMSILMAIALTGVHGSVEGWYVPGVDVIGFDSYYLNTELMSEQYAKSKGKPLIFPEFGDSIAGTSDAASAVFARQFIAALDSNTIAACWYNNNGNVIGPRPQTLAVLRALA